MATITQEYFDSVLQQFVQKEFRKGMCCLHAFIPCIEYSKEFWPIEYYPLPIDYNARDNPAVWHDKKYCLSPHNTYTMYDGTKPYTTNDPIVYFLSTFTEYIKKFENGDIGPNGFRYVDASNELFLEFDFRNLFDSPNRQKLFGERNETEAFNYYRECIKHNTHLISEMKLAYSKKIGDINRAMIALNKYKDYEDVFKKLEHGVHDFVPWLHKENSREHYHRTAYYNNYAKGVEAKDFKITDFYTIVPDDPSAEDLIAAYESRKEFIKTRTSKINNRNDADLLYTEKFKKGIEASTDFNMNMFLLAVFTREEFEELIVNSTRFYLEQFTNFDQFKSQCTISNLLKVYDAWRINYFKSYISSTQDEQDKCANKWIYSVANSTDKYIIVKIFPSLTNGHWKCSCTEILTHE